MGSPQGPPVAHVPGWENIPQLAHGFCGRRGGVSPGDFADLNLSDAVGDDPACVRENWRRVIGATVGPLRVVTMRQMHGARIAHVDERSAGLPEADALISRSAGLALGILTADCVPIFLVVPRARVVAAVHAGWRGTVLGIARQVVQALEKTFSVTPAAIRAAMGPTVGACCYEVDRGITDDLERRWGAMPDAVARHGTKSRLDLRQANVAILTGS